MDKDELILLVEDLVTVPHCCTELKEAGQKWIASVGTPDEKTAAESLIAEIEEDIVPIDDLVSFAESESALRAFGEERATEFRLHAYELKASGAKYCDCAACTKALHVLEQKEALLKAEPDEQA